MDTIRVAGVVFGVTGAWTEAHIDRETATNTALLAEWTAEPEYLHVYGPEGQFCLAVTDALGVPKAPVAGQLALEVTALCDAVYVPFAGLLDAETGGQLSLADGWVLAEWQGDARIEALDGESAARLRIFQGATVLATALVPLREEVEVAISAPASVLESEVFTLTLTASDGEGAALPRYAGQNLAVTGISGTAPSAELLDAATNEAPDFTAGWVAGVWTGQVYIAVVCDDLEVVARNAATEVVLDSAMIEVVALTEALTLALRERQLATGRSPWAIGSSYTFAQYQAEVNALAPYFVAGTYSGGASTPTLQANTVANGAAALADLVPLVSAMLEMYRDAAAVGSEHGEGSGTAMTPAGAQAAALEDFKALGGSGGPWTSSYRIWISEAGWTATALGAAWRLRAGNLGSGGQKTVKFFTRHTGTGITTWDTCGHSGVPSAANVYQNVWNVDATGLTTIDTAFLGNQNAAPDCAWPATYNQKRGYGALNAVFALVVYAFTEL
jgi:hypothetical protein